MRRFSKWAAGVFLFPVGMLVFLSQQGPAQPFFEQQQKLNSPNFKNLDRYGISVAVDGNTAVVSADFENNGGSQAGAVYVYVESGGVWTQQAKLTPSDAAANKFFGRSVDIDGDTVVVGAVGDGDGGLSAGAVYVFTRSGSTWSQQAKLLPSDIDSGKFVGTSVAVSGDTLLAGANSGQQATTSVAVFVRSGTTWSEQALLRASDEGVGDVFGGAVDIDGDVAVIGASGDDDNGHRSGTAYIFRRAGSSWSQEQKIIGSSVTTDDHFGEAVSVSGNVVVVGAKDNDDVAFGAGAAYVFEWNGSSWTETAKLTASDENENDTFGASVKILGATIVVGSPKATVSGFEAGAAYVFEDTGSGWTQKQKIFSTDPEAGDTFGQSVSLRSDLAIVGAPGKDEGGFDRGAVYTFTRTAAQAPQEPAPPTPTPTPTVEPPANVDDWSLYN